MTDELFRKEALEHQSRALYGEVVLKSPPATWLITFILVIIFGLIIALLFLGQVETDTGSRSVINWLLSRDS
jgi:hypothetical protein